MSPPRPLPPLQGWPTQRYDEAYGFLWYCGGGLLVSQTVVDHGTVEAAHAYHDTADQVLATCAEDMERSGGLYVIHDLRQLRTYDAAARKVWQERMRRRGRGYLRGSTVVVREASPLLKMAVQGVNMMASLNLGSRIELSTDLSAVLRKHRVAPPGPDVPFPGLPGR
jgi:hypothetical protein